MYCDILRNPIIVGILVGVVVYLFMKHKNKKNEKTNKTEKNKKNKHSAFVIPGMAGIIAGFLVWTLNESDKKTVPVPPTKINIPQNNDNIVLENGPLIAPEINDANNSMIGGASIDKMNSYQLIGKGIQVPTNLPDAFLDMDLF